MSSQPTIGIVGAGLVGCLAALAFANKGFPVCVYDARPDLRDAQEQHLSQLRSINLAVSSRGILAIESINKEMAARVLKDLIPMRGRMIHLLNGDLQSQDYGLYGEAINSIDRAVLNRSLLDELDKLDNVTLYFNHKLVQVDFNHVPHPVALFEPTNNGTPSFSVSHVAVWIGADGSFSRMRSQLQRVVKMDYSQKYIDHYYLELKILPKSQAPKPALAYDSGPPDSEFLLNPNHLHIWPRHEYMLIALANQDGSFTCTLFAPHRMFDQELLEPTQIIKFFKDTFPDALELMGEDLILQSFANNPRGSLVSVKCSPYNYKGKCVLLGDAAHSMVPFYGQGMNCGFEDVRVLLDFCEKTNFDFDRAFTKFSHSRHKDLVAIVDLSMENYIEMRHKVVSTLYLVRKKLDNVLYKLLGDNWLPLYTMVSFRPDVRYSRALSEHSRQNKVISRVIQTTGLIGSLAILWHAFRR